jgi:DNA-binding CsgD family transcriptional regulator
MKAISVQKVQALSRNLERLYTTEGPEQFPSTVFSALSEIIEESVCSLDIVNRESGQVTIETSDHVLRSSKIENRIVELVSSNPPVAVARAGATDAIRSTDRTAQWQFEQASPSVDLFAPIGVRRQAVVTLDVSHHVANITVNPDTSFTDEETLLLSLAASHLALAHRNIQRLESLREAAAQVVPAPEDLKRVGLTPREAEVLHWVMKGKQDGAIAGILKISVRTVHQHVARILRKLQSESRASASYEAMMKLKALGSPRPSAA